MRVQILSAQFVIVEVIQSHCGHHKVSLWTHKINVRSHKVFVGHKKIIVKAQKLIKRPCNVIVRQPYSFWRSQRVIVKVTWCHCQGTQVIVKVHRHCEGIQCEGHIESLGGHAKSLWKLHWGFVRRQRFTMRAHKLLHKATVQPTQSPCKSLWGILRVIMAHRSHCEKHTDSLRKAHRVIVWGHKVVVKAHKVILRPCKVIVRACLHCIGHTVIVKVIHGDCEGTESLWWHTKSPWGSHRVIIKAHWVTEWEHKVIWKVILRLCEGTRVLMRTYKSLWGL